MAVEARWHTRSGHQLGGCCGHRQCTCVATPLLLTGLTSSHPPPIPSRAAGIPLVYELDADLKPVKHYYLADEATVKAKIEAVAKQGSAAGAAAAPAATAAAATGGAVAGTTSA